MSMTVPEVLKAAADLIEKPDAWTQKTNARGADGFTLMALNPAATCWCIDGAIIRVAGNTPERAYAATFLERLLGDRIYMFNDHPDCTQEMAVEYLRLAAEEANG